MKTLLAVVLVGLAVPAFADGRVIDLAKVTNPVLSAHVDGKPAPAPEGTSVAVTEKGGKVVFHRPNGHPEEMTAVITNAIANYPGVTTSGLLTFDGWANFRFGAPMTLTGPVAHVFAGEIDLDSLDSGVSDRR